MTTLPDKLDKVRFSSCPTPQAAVDSIPMTEALPKETLTPVPLPANEVERLAALHRYKVLDTPPEATFDRLTALAARLFDMPIALVSLVDESRAWFKSCYGFDVREVQRDATICSFALLSNDVLVVPDARQDDRLACNPFVQSEPGLRFYAGAPLLTHDGFNLGTLCLLDTKPRNELSDEQKVTLADLAAMVVDELELRVAARKIAQIDSAMLQVTQGVAAATGKAFFFSLVQHLAQALEVDCAYISLVVGSEPEAARTIATCVQGKIVDNFEYLLCDTPCQTVIQQRTLCSYPRGVPVLFPYAPVLALLSVESYVALPFFDSTGTPLGLLGIMSQKPLENLQLVESLLTIFAVRIATELERQQAEASLRESEERYRYLAESIPQLVWTADAEGVLLDVNQRWSDFTGLTLAQAQTAGWEAIVHPDDVPILNQHWVVAQQEGSLYQAEGRMRQADGVYRWHLHQAVPLKNQRGQISKWFGTATDIEDQKRLEQQRDLILQQEQAARQEAERANRIKDEFLAVLSHELRSPLNPILGWSRLLQTKTLDAAKTKQALATIERNAKLQTELITDLLDVSRILQGKLSLNVCPVDLVSTIQAAIETVRLAAEAKSIQIQTQLEPDVGQISGDTSRLQQIIWNFLSNAVKFTPLGGRVNIRLERHGVQAQVTVSDTGKGIAPSFLPYVFDSFRQADSATTRHFGGLGLGLAIVRHLVELHGGTVQAESLGEGQGATFLARFPLIPTQLKLDLAQRRLEQALDLTGINVLVVDDDTDTREFVAFLLEQHGANVTAVASAGEGLSLLTQLIPDVLLSDIGMPEMDGYMLLQQVRTLPPEQGGQIPAIALTAYAGEINYQQALAAGFQKHIPKPVEPDQLVAMIANLARQSQSPRL